MKRIFALAFPFLVLAGAVITPVAGERGEPVRQVIFVSYHSDGLWRAGWLVHESLGGALSPELIANLGAIGCDLGIK